MRDYEHIGRRVVVHTAAEADHIEAVVAGPTDPAAAAVAVDRAAGHTVEGVGVGSIDSVVGLGLDTETLVTAGIQETVAVDQVGAEAVYYILPVLEDREMRVRHMGQE